MENKTAVEWFWETIKNTEPSLEWYKILEQAKEMEKQQIIDAYIEGDKDFEKNPFRYGDDYYNETFKK